MLAIDEANRLMQWRDEDPASLARFLGFLVQVTMRAGQPCDYCYDLLGPLGGSPPFSLLGVLFCASADLCYYFVLPLTFVLILCFR